MVFSSEKFNWKEIFKRYFQAILLYLFAIGCVEETPPTKAPMIITGEVVQITDQGALFSGLITNDCDPNSEYGFNLKSDGSYSINGLTINAKSPAIKGPFSIQVTSDLIPNTKYTVKTFGISGSQIIYGNSVVFVSKGSAAAIISDFSPLSLIAGDTITISGRNFSLSSASGANVLSIGSLPASVVSSTGTVLKAIVPYGLTTGEYVVRLSTIANTTKFVASNKLKVISPFSDEIAYGLPAPDPVQRIDPTSLVINGEGYYGLGAGPQSLMKNDFWKFSPATSTWTRLADFPAAGRTRAISFAINGIAYVGMGTSNGTTYLQDLWAYNPATNTWSRKADHPVIRTDFPVWFSIGDKGYYGLGTGLRDFWEYNATNNTWVRLSDFAGTFALRSNFTKFASDKKGYIAFGLGSGNTPRTDLWEFDPNNNSWAPKSSISVARYNAVGFVRDNKIVISSGRTATGYLSDTWVFNLTTGGWSQTAKIPRNQMTATTSFTIDNVSYIFGGTDYFTHFSTYITYTWP